MEGDGYTCHFGDKYIYESYQYGSIFAAHYDANGEPDFSKLVIGIYAPTMQDHVFTKFVVDANEEYLFYVSIEDVYRLNNLTHNTTDWDRIEGADFTGIINAIGLSHEGHIFYYGGNTNEGQPKLFKLENCDTAITGVVDITPSWYA